MAKPLPAATIRFKVSNTIGIRNKQQIILLGRLLEGSAAAGLYIVSPLHPADTWRIAEVVELEFINQNEQGNFIWLVVDCETPESYRLLKALRLYDETITLRSSASVKA